MIWLRLRKDLLHLRVRHQIEVTLAIADFRVFESVPFGWRRAQGLGEDDEADDFDGNLAGLGREHRAAHADEIRKVEMLENGELVVAEDVFLRVNLDAPALVADVHEHGFAHVAVRGDAAGERDFAAFGVILPRVGARFGRSELVFERVNAFGPQRGQLGLALFNQCIRVVHQSWQSKSGSTRFGTQFDLAALAPWRFCFNGYPETKKVELCERNS